MLHFVLTLALAASCALSAPNGDVFLPLRDYGPPIVPMLDGRIVGGSVVSIADFPYIASLRFIDLHICGASIISPSWTVTAAHCIIGMSTASLSFRAGSSLYASGGVTREVSKGVIHGSYNSVTKNFDIAVLSVGEKVTVTFPLGTIGVNAISMPGQGSRPDDGVNATVSGWGVTSETGLLLSPQLLAATVPIMSLATCRGFYGTAAITDNMLCAGFAAGGVDACQGDSGGPLAISNLLVGVVSWGIGCARPNFPGVYVNVGSVRDWISQNTGV